MILRPEWTAHVGGISVFGWSNHYNVARDRCYVRVTLQDNGAVAAGIPVVTYTVFDAFDADGPGVACTDQPDVKPMFCSVTDAAGEDKYGACAECRQLAKQLMSN